MIRFARISFFLATAFASMAQAGSAEIFLLPKSDKVFRVQVDFPAASGQKPQAATLLVREGTLAIVANKDSGVRVGFSPTLGRNGSVEVTSFRIVKTAENDDSVVEPMGSLKTQVGGPARPFFQLVGPEIKLRVLSVSEGSFPETPPYEGNLDFSNPGQIEALREIYGDTSSAICCVGCGPIIVCANAVNLDCGVCDSAGHHRI